MIKLSISPEKVNIPVGAKFQFKYALSGYKDDATVDWTVQTGAGQDGGMKGTIDQFGLYSSPGIEGKDTIVVTSKEDKNKTAIAVVTCDRFPAGKK